MIKFLRRLMGKHSKAPTSPSSGLPSDALPPVAPAALEEARAIQKLIAAAPGIHDAEALAAELTRQKLRDLYLFAIETCLRRGATRWWEWAIRLETMPDLAQCVAALKTFCLHHVLREAGDLQAFHRIYLVLRESGLLMENDSDRLLLRLVEYLLGELRRIERLDRRAGAKPRIAVSIVILDDETLQNFIDFCLPSLATAGNLRAMSAGRDATLLVFARAKDLASVERAIKAQAHGCGLVVQAVSDDLIGQAKGPRFEWLLGGLQMLHLIRAQRIGADFHQLNPNAIYSERCFEALLRLAARGRKAILLASFASNRNAIRPELEPFRSGPVLEVEAMRLASLGLRTIDAAGAAVVVRDAGSFGCVGPHPMLIWLGTHCAHIHAAHHGIAYLAHEVFVAHPPRFYSPLSTELDRLLPEDLEPHFVGDADDIALVELSGPRADPDVRRADLSGYPGLFWQFARDRHGEYFRREVRLPLLNPSIDDRPWKELEVIDAERNSVFQVVGTRQIYNIKAPAQMLTGLAALQSYELSEYGRENMDGVFVAVRALLEFRQFDIASIDLPERKDLIRALTNFDLVDLALDYAKAGESDTAFTHEFLRTMLEIKAVNVARAEAIRRNAGDRPVSVVGAIVWGASYVEKFMNYHVRSLLASGNLPALAAKGPVIHSIVTTPPDCDRIMAHPVFARLRKHAEVVFACFPEGFPGQREQSGYNFYHFYGFLDHQNVLLASALRADLYLLPVDCVYSNGSLANLSRYLAAEADCCAVAGIESQESEFLAWLESRVGADGILDLPAEEQIQASCQSAGRYYRSLIMSPENRRFCRHPRELVWPVERGYAVHSVFLHPIAVSARLLSRPFHPHYENVDYALLPRLVQRDGRLKVIEDARELAITHFSEPQVRDDYLEGGFSLKSFLEAHRYDYAIHRRCFAAQQLFPCRDSRYPPSSAYPQELDLIKAGLARYRFAVEPGNEFRPPAWPLRPGVATEAASGDGRLERFVPR